VWAPLDKGFKPALAAPTGTPPALVVGDGEGVGVGVEGGMVVAPGVEAAEFDKHLLPAPSALYGIGPDQASSPLASSNESVTSLPINEAGKTTLFQVKDVPVWSPRSARISPQGSVDPTMTRLYGGALVLSQLNVMGLHAVMLVGVSMLNSAVTPWIASRLKRATERSVANIFAVVEV